MNSTIKDCFASPRLAGGKCKIDQRSPQDSASPLSKINRQEGETGSIEDTENVDFESNHEKENDAISKDTDEKELGYNADGSPPMINEPLLAFIVFAMQSGTIENTKKAVLGFFTADRILKAKGTLWRYSCNIMIGKKVARRSTDVRPEEEANLVDIIMAIQKLDKLEKMPEIVISAYDLGRIPRSVPEELNDISIVDCLAKAEDRIREIEKSVVRNANEIHAFRGEDAGNKDKSRSAGAWDDMRVDEWNEDA
jgi:hypothetical protein